MSASKPTDWCVIIVSGDEAAEPWMIMSGLAKKEARRLADIPSKTIWAMSVACETKVFLAQQERRNALWDALAVRRVSL